MAFTKVRGRGVTTTDNYTVGVITATKFVGPITGGGGGIQVGLLTATGLDINGDADISGNLTVGGDFTTLNTTLREVELLHVDANSSATAGIITQRGSGDILNLFDTNTEVLTVKDGGDVGIGTDTPNGRLDVTKDSGTDYSATTDQRSSAQIIARNNTAGTNNFASISLVNGGGTQAEASINLIETGSYLGDITFKSRTGGSTWSEKLRIDSAGNMGLGITPDGQGGTVDSLQIGTATNLYNESSDDYTILGNNVYFDGSNNKYIKTQQSSRLMQNAGEFTFNQAVSGSADANITYTTPLKIDASGNIQVSTTIDTSAHYIKINANRSTHEDHLGGVHGVWNGNTVGAINFLAGADTSNKDDGHLQFITYAGGTAYERLRITSGGQLTMTNAATTTFLDASTTSSGTNTRGLISLSGKTSSNAAVTLKMGGFGDTNRGEIFTHSNHGLGFATNNAATQMVLTTGGHLGVGLVTGVDTRLTVKAASGTDVVGKFTSTDAKAWIQFRDNSTTDTGVMIGAEGDDMMLRAGSNERVRIASNGNIDVVTGHLSLDNDKGIFFDGTTTTKDTIWRNSSENSLNMTSRYHMNLFIDSNNDDTNAYFAVNKDHTTKASATELFRVQSDGRVGIGTDAPADDPLTLYDADNNVGMYFQCPASGNANNNGFRIGRNDSHCFVWNYQDAEIALATAGVERLTINHSGGPGITVKGEIATAQDYPNYRPTLDFNFAAVKKLDPRITYSRTGPASYIDEFGKVVLVGANTPRFDHDPTTRESKGLLVEPSRTNLFPYGTTPGNNFNHSKTGTFTENTTEVKAPDGSYTATKWTFTDSDPYLYHNQTLNANTTYTMSMWVKAGTNMAGDWLQFRIGGNPYSAQADSIIPADGTWRRITYTRTIGGSNESGANIGFEPQTSPSGNPASGDVIYIWGAQLEVGGYVTSFIPTNGETATRGADFTTLRDDDFTDAISQIEGTLVAEYDNVTSDGYVLSLDTGGNGKIGMVNSNGYQMMGHNGTTSQGTTDNGTLLSGTNRFALAYKTNDAAISINGNTATVDTVYALPTTTFMSIGHRQNQYDHLGSCIARIMCYNTRLPNSQLKTLSTR